ncbi:MAG: right-handed parallel beta-helix repeat-containing protein [Tepidisphaerales bacterium]
MMYHRTPLLSRPAKPRAALIERLEPRRLLSTWYVAPSGSNSNPGSANAPFLTLQKAADTVVAGDTVDVQAGTYAGFVMGWDFPQAGTAAAPITFHAEPGATITSGNIHTADGIDLEPGCDYVVIENFTVNNASGTITRAGIRVTGSDNVIVRNNTTDNNGTWGIFTSHANYVDIENNIASHSHTQHGIYVSNASVGPIVRGNTVFGNYAAGIHMNGDLSQGGNGLITGALVENNTIYDNGVGGGSGINCDGVQDSRFQNNLLYNNHASGISLYQIDAADGAKNNVVVNNTIIMASDGRWAININSGSTGNTVYNNILYNYHSFHGAISITADSLPGFTSDYNAVISRFTPDDGNTELTLAQWQAQTGQDLHSIIATPAQLFVNPATNDYHLSPTSPAINAGTSLPSPNQPPAYDLAANPRPAGGAFDIGAYEMIPQQITVPGAASGNTWFIAQNAGNIEVRTGSPSGTLVGSYPSPSIAGITFNGGPGDDSLTILTPLPFMPAFAGQTGNDSLTIDAGTFTLSADLSASTASLALSIDAAAVTLAAPRHLRSPSLSASAVLDVASYVLVINDATSSLPTIRQYIVAGRLRTSQPQHTLAAIDNNSLRLASFNNTPIAGGSGFNQLILTPALPGDTNLDGKVDPSDYLNVIANMGRVGGTWFDGDLDQNGIVTPDDLAVVSAHLGTGAAAIPQLQAQPAAALNSARERPHTTAHAARSRSHSPAHNRRFHRPPGRPARH